MPKKELTAHDAEQSIGYGYSKIINDLLTALDRPITNSDEFRNYYKQMISNDETISTALEYLTGGVTAKIGSYTNSLENTMNSLTITSANLTETDSRIRDADMSQAMMRFVKLQILNQSGTSMLAQANQTPQSVLSLMQ